MHFSACSPGHAETKQGRLIYETLYSGVEVKVDKGTCIKRYSRSHANYFNVIIIIMTCVSTTLYIVAKAEIKRYVLKDTRQGTYVRVELPDIRVHKAAYTRTIYSVL